MTITSRQRWLAALRVFGSPAVALAIMLGVRFYVASSSERAHVLLDRRAPNVASAKTQTRAQDRTVKTGTTSVLR